MKKKEKIKKVEVKLYKGTPTLFINGKPDPALVYMTYNPNKKYFSQFGKEGIHIYSFSATPTESAYGFCKKACWIEPDRFDYSEFDERVEMLIKADPDAYFFPRLYLSSPRWWDEKYPDQLVNYDSGNREIKPLFHYPPDKRVPSWASKKWRIDTRKALGKFIEYAEDKYGDRIIGYHIASGTTEEWMMWGANENLWADYSKPAEEFFKKFLKRKYKTVENLKRAWKDKKVDFNNVSLPAKEERERTSMGFFRDSDKEQKVIDFYFFLSELTADTICYFSKVVKEKTNFKKLVGTFYGYIFQLAGKHHLQNAGHLSIKKVLNCKYIDFLCSPTSYYFRKIKNGYSHFMSVTDSVKLNGKLWFDENDIRTYIAKGKIGLWGKGKNVEDTLKLERREFANVICNGCGQWWFDMGGGWFDDRKLLKEIRKMKKIGDETLKYGRSNIDEIAVVVDDKSFCYTEVGSEFTHYLIMEQLPEIGRIGAPVGFYLLDDLGKISDHKFYIFLNCFAPDKKNIRDIEKIKKNGNVLLWIYAAGLYKNNKIDLKEMRKLTGFDIRYLNKKVDMKIKIEKKSFRSVFQTYFKSSGYGINRSFYPIFYSADKSAISPGKIEDTDLDGFVFKDFKNWKSFYSSVPVVPSFILREMAKMAGCHIFCKDDVVIYGNKSFLSMVADKKGEYVVGLPEKKKIYDLFTGKFIGERKEFSQIFEDGETKLWKTT